jgi:hypothetical protein
VARGSLEGPIPPLLCVLLLKKYILGVGGMAQVVECLSIKCKALGSIPSAIKNKKYKFNNQIYIP